METHEPHRSIEDEWTEFFAAVLDPAKMGTSDAEVRAYRMVYLAGALSLYSLLRGLTSIQISCAVQSLRDSCADISASDEYEPKEAGH